MLLGYISNHLRMMVQKSLWKNGRNFFFWMSFFFEDFHPNFWLQSTLKNLIYVIYQYFNMSKDAYRCGASIALWIKSIRPVHPKIFSGGDSIVNFFGKNRLGEVAKEAFSSGVETTFPCEQITIDVTSFGELLYQRRSQRRPKQKRDLYSTECILESQKTNRTRREAPRRNVMESKHTEAAARRAEVKFCEIHVLTTFLVCLNFSTFYCLKRLVKPRT